MNYTNTFRLHAALWIALGMLCFSSDAAWAGEPAWWTKQKRDCGLPSDLAYNNWNGECRSGTNNSPAPAIDYEAEHRQREAAAAEAAAEAERQRLADERRRKEEAERQAAFIRSRDEAVDTLKGSIGNFDGGLKGSSDNGLRGVTGGQELKGSTTPGLGQAKLHSVDPAPTAERNRLAVRDQQITAAIARDVTAIKKLGFAGRAEDFAEWENLGADAKASFEKEIVDTATDAAIAKVRGRLLEGFKSFDEAQAARWIGRLAKVQPRPVELIGLIEGLAKVKDKAKIAESAELVLDRIEQLQKAGQLAQPVGHGQAREDLLLVGLDLVCDVVPAPGDRSCKLFKTTSKLTVASLYNNASRRVAVREVERLTTMTESQLHALARINELMAKHVRERNEVRAKIKQLENSP